MQNGQLNLKLFVVRKTLILRNTKQDAIHFEIATYRVLHERRNKTPSFAEQLKFQEKLTYFTYALSAKVAN